MSAWNNLDMSQGGGGYMDESQTAGPSDDKSDVRRGQNCVPLMIGHLNKTSDDLSLWGLPVKTVVIMGIVRQIEQVTTKVTFEIEDETGSIKALKWLEADAAVYEAPVKVNSYARVYGLLRDQSGSRHLLALSVQPLKNLNELISHLLEVTYVTMQAEKMKEGIMKQDSTFMNQSVIGSDAIESGSMLGLSPDQAAVMKVIVAFSKDSDGVERDVIKSKVPPSLRSSVDSILDNLSSEGHIYTTKTDDYFRVI